MAADALRRWLPVVGWAAVIFAFSSVPDLGPPGGGRWDLVLSTGAHLAEYVVLGALLARALASAPVAIAVGVLYAVSDELHQTYVSGRVGSVWDVAVDAVGVATGALLVHAVVLRPRAA